MMLESIESEFIYAAYACAWMLIILCISAVEASRWVSIFKACLWSDHGYDSFIQKYEYERLSDFVVM